jgi:hypothetical protein
MRSKLLKMRRSKKTTAQKRRLRGIKSMKTNFKMEN